MKNIIKIFLSLLAVVSFSACEDANNIIDQVVADTTAGTIVRTIQVNSNTLNSSIASTEFSVDVEVQNANDGADVVSLDLYVTIRDLSPDNGTTPPSEALVKSIPASEFTTGPVGLPRATVKATFGETSAAMGLTSADYFPGDLYVYEIRAVLTDGTVWGAKDAAGIITGGFFSSPYLYNALLLCSPEPGVYTVDMHDSFGDGWQTNGGNGGNGIQVTITNPDGSETIIEVGMCTPYEASPYDCTGPASTAFFDATATVEIPVGSQAATWNNPGDQYGEISFEIYAPDGSLLLAVGLGEGTPGLMPVTLCAQ